MWKRLKRALMALFGGAIDAIENPRLVLEQNIRELNDQVPKMNESIATVKANVTLLEKEHRRYEAQLQDLTAKIRAAIQAGRDDIAQTYALQLQQTQEARDRTAEQLRFAREAYDKALQVKQAFMRERQRKIDEAREALRAHERAQWQRRIADTLEQFEVGGIDQTHTEMVRRLNEETARAEARMEMALDAVDTDVFRIEEEAQNLRAAELVRQLKLEMGLAQPDTAPTPPLPSGERTEETSKTAGRVRSADGPS